MMQFYISGAEGFSRTLTWLVSEPHNLNSAENLDFGSPISAFTIISTSASKCYVTALLTAPERREESVFDYRQGQGIYLFPITAKGLPERYNRLHEGYQGFFLGT